MPITLNDFKEGGSLRNFVTQVGLLGKIEKVGVDQDKLLDTLINAVTMTGAYTDSNKDGKLTKDDAVSEKFSKKEDDEGAGGDDKTGENTGNGQVNGTTNSENTNVNADPNWVETDRTETSRVCIQEEEANTGYATVTYTVTYTDQNENSSTYNTTKTETETATVEDLENCPLPVQSPSVNPENPENNGTQTDGSTTTNENDGSGDGQ
jgi:hypothetical protein